MNRLSIDDGSLRRLSPMITISSDRVGIDTCIVPALLRQPTF
jgi:hypothetical protein